MQKLKFAELSANLESFDPWLRTLGIDPKNDRIHTAIKLLRQADAISRGEQKAPTPQEAEKFYFGLMDAIEIQDIFVAFGKTDSEGLKEKLARAFSGPHRLADETPKTSDGRNTMFELSLAAELMVRGLTLEIGEPDIWLPIGSGYFVECKRPYRQDNVRANIRGAADQLEANLERKENEACGVVAVSASRLLNPGDKIFVADSGDLGLQRLGDVLEKLVVENQWNRMLIHPRICALLFHVSTPAIIKAENLITHLSYVQVFPIGKQAEQQRLLRQVMNDLFRDAKAKVPVAKSVSEGA
jgi:hypothetical protein